MIQVAWKKWLCPFFAFFFLAPTMPAAAPQSTNQFYQSPGTKRMAERLARLPQESDPLVEQFMNRERAALLGAEIERASRLPQGANSGSKMVELISNYATELLNAGQNEAAIQ